jgi:hypothetical protein
MNDSENLVDSFESRIQNAAKASGLAADLLTAKLAEMGIANTPGCLDVLDDDEVFKFGEFRETLKEEPIVKLRLAFKFLKGAKKAEDRGQVDDRTAQLRALGLKVRLGDLPTDQLLRLYDPTKPSDPVTTALKGRFGSAPLIAFRETGEVALQETLDYTSGLEQNFPAQETIMVDGVLTRLYPAGVKPDVMVDEDPVFPGKPLRNGMSTVNNRNWSKVEFKARQLCRLVVNRGDVDPDNREATLRLIERAQAGFVTLQEAYPEAHLEFRDAERQAKLPTLKISLSDVAAKPQNPFGIARKY